MSGVQRHGCESISRLRNAIRDAALERPLEPPSAPPPPQLGDGETEARGVDVVRPRQAGHLEAEVQLF